MRSERKCISAGMLLAAAAPLLAFSACRKEPPPPEPKAEAAPSQPAPAGAPAAGEEPAQEAASFPEPQPQDTFQFPEPEPFQSPDTSVQGGQPAYVPEPQVTASQPVPAADTKTGAFPDYGLDSNRMPVEPPGPEDRVRGKP